jgi:hypothetical protein
MTPCLSASLRQSDAAASEEKGPIYGSRLPSELSETSMYLEPDGAQSKLASASSIIVVGNGL